MTRQPDKTPDDALPFEASPIEALYIHVPFCRPICPFCAFAVHGDRADLHTPYLEALASDMARQASQHADLLRAHPPLRSVYFGGGTPSRLTLEEMETLFTQLHHYFSLDANAEIALEFNPEDVSKEFIQGLRTLGVNRVSLGLQSLDDATLQALGRGHTAAQGRAAVHILQAHGPPNLNVDLMFDTPGIPTEVFKADLRTAVDWAPAHISLYGLDVEPGTLFGRDPSVRSWVEGHVEERNEAYLWASEELGGQGYLHYEVSNFCRQGMEGLQNRMVWRGGNYLGFGPGAHGHVNGRRTRNLRHLPAYLRATQAGTSPVDEEEVLGTVQKANEALMLALRTDVGLNGEDWALRYGLSWDERRRAVATRLVREGRAIERTGRLSLTARGYLLADEIAATLAEGER